MNIKSTFCIFALALALNLVVISGRPAEDGDVPSTSEISDTESKSTAKEVSDGTTEGPTPSQSSPLSSSSAAVSSSSVAVLGRSADVPQADEPNSPSQPEVENTSKPPKETTTVPPLIHTASGISSVSISTTTTTVATPAVSSQGTTVSTPASKPPGSGQSAATGLQAVQFSCFVASAFLVLLR